MVAQGCVHDMSSWQTHFWKPYAVCHAVNCTISCLVAFPSLITRASDLITNDLEHFAV